MLATGDVLRGKYRLLREIAAGGMGRVFEAEHLFTGQRVAIKVLHATLLDDVTQRHRFLREARACVRIAHPNIVQVFDLDMDDSGACPFIVQEFLHGETLAQALDRIPSHQIEPGALLRLVVPLMGALVGAHRRGVVHRDLKPANLFLCATPTGTVPKLLDFGVAKVRTDGSETVLTATGLLIGTPEYMSPEQVAGESTVDAQTDVWAMGVVLYEALTGRLPFEGASAQTLMVQVLHGSVVPVDTRGAWVPPDLAAVVHRALTRDRARRYPTMQRMLEALLETSAWTTDAAPPEFNTTVRDLEASAPPAGTAIEPPVRTLALDPPRRSPGDSPPAPPSPHVRAATVSVPWWALALGALLLVTLALLVGRALGRGAD